MLKNIFYPTVFTAVALLVLAILAAPRTLASPSTVTFTVDTIADRLDDDTSDGLCHTSVNTCSLRAAIMQANHLSAPGVTTIIVPAGTYTLTRPLSGANGEDNGDLNLTAPLGPNQSIIINGAGAASTIIDANQIDRVFRIESGRTASIGGVTIRNGYLLAANGGGIFNNGSLTISNATLSGNHADYGGGIYNNLSLTVTNSTISQNTTASEGGGILNYGDLIVRNSTIYGNRAPHGGGIFNGGNLAVVNSTLSQNNANADGGGIHNSDGAANVYNTSIVFNGADADGNSSGVGGGVFNNDSFAIFNLRNTLVAGNSTGTSVFAYYDDCAGTLSVYGLNRFKAVLVSSGCTINTANGGWEYINALNTIGPLQNNGGPTWTHALLRGSNAIDGATPCIDYNSSLLPTDQRGWARVVDGDADGIAVCDIGAFEYDPPLYLPLILR